MAKSQRHNAVARQTLADASFLFPAQPDGGFRGKTPSAYSELRFKLKIDVCKTIWSPRSADEKVQFRLFVSSLRQRCPVLLNAITADQVSCSQNHFVRRRFV